MSDLKDKVVIITGAAMGQGAAEAALMAGQGARVMVADVADDRGRAVADSVGGEFFHLDVSNESQWGELVARTLGKHGRIDALVNNAGVYRGSNLFERPSESFNQVTAINQLGTLLGMQSVAGHMRERGSGSIVNVSSIAGMRGMDDIVYGAGKWALRGMTRSAARQLGPHGVRVNVVLPGFVNTDLLNEDIGKDKADASIAKIPLGRIGEPQDIASVVAFLVSERSAYCSGGEFVVDGGFLA